MTASRTHAVALIVGVLLAAIEIAKADLTLIRDGASDYVICCASNAPASVHDGATELQRVIRVATGVELPIVTAPAPRMICLGANAAARAAGLSVEGVPLEGFRTITTGDCLYILGPDTPDGEVLWKAGRFECVSRGTLFGVYAFLEDVVGVRWLMPGEWGEEIPRQTELVVPAMDETDAPDIQFRQLHGVHDRDPAVELWMQRNRQGRSIHPGYSHSFDDHPGPEALQGHPDWMPMRLDGTREPIWTGHKPGVYVTHKYCLSNPDLARAFGASIIRRFDRQPQRYGDAMSPSDGGGWCQCPACLQHVDKDVSDLWGALGRRRLVSYTPLVLRFYNAVARAVAVKYPDRHVGGFAYAGYLYPPREPIPLESNVDIGIAYSPGYGYKLYKPEAADEFVRLFDAWRKSAGRLAYSDYCTWKRNAVGAPLPPPRDMLKLIYGTLHKHQAIASRHMGHESWGTGAAHNYLVAKLMWHADADVEVLYDDFMRRAYGPAAEAIRTIYDVVEERLRAYMLAHRFPDHEVRYIVASEVYAPVFGQMEQLYGKALAAAQTESQRARIRMFGDNLVILHWNMRRVGLLAEPEKSIFYRFDEDYGRFIEAKTGSLAVVNLDQWRKRGERYGMPTMALWAPEERSVTVPRLGSGVVPPAIDGELSDACWRAAGVAGAFRARGTHTPAEQRQTRVRMAYDDTHLYIAAECFENEPDKILMGCRTRDDGGIFQDDVLEVLIGNRSVYKDNFWHLVVNPANTQWDAIVADTDYNIDFRSATGRTPEAWTIELAIPFEGMNVRRPPAGRTWHGNFCRTRRVGRREHTTWSSVEESFLTPETFGEWVFAE